MADVWEFAKDIEVSGKEYYEKLADESAIEELSGVFTFLAGEEQRHYEIFDAMEKGLPAPELKHSGALQNAKDAFNSLASSLQVSEVIEDSESAYQKALGFEQKSIDLYQKALVDAKDDQQKAALEFIINQEKKHYRIVEAMMEFVRRPKEWLENAEWNHLDAY